MMYVYYRDMNASAIAEHAWTSHHDVNWEPKVLNVCDRWHVRCLLECWLMTNAVFINIYKLDFLYLFYLYYSLIYYI